MTDLNHIDSYDYELPAQLIATQPLDIRSASRLLHLQVSSRSCYHRGFCDLLDWFKAGDVLVLNDTHVIAARFYGKKASGGKLEGLLERIESETKAWVQLKASKSPAIDSVIYLDDDTAARCIARDGALFLLQLESMPAHLSLSWLAYCKSFGHVPLPPYMQREDTQTDHARYQCVFHDEKKPGAVAAPTAGLHFDDALIQKLQQKGVAIMYVTLHVGAGTFLPVRVDELDSHHMHSEWCELTQQTAASINQVRTAASGRIVAVGTTVLRTLESAIQADGLLQAFSGATNIFIKPGHQVKSIDALITNFHLPKSTLLVLVCALAGYEFMMQAYQVAIDHEYRFFSYGDAMLIDLME